MLEHFTSFLKILPGRMLPRYSGYLDYVERYLTKHYVRFTDAYGHEHVGIGMLRQVLNNVDYDWMVKNNNDITSYLHHLRFVKNDLDNVFNPVSTGRSYRNLFFAKHGSNYTHEYLCIVDDVDTISSLPFGSPWDEWRTIRPMRIWTHDSPEFSLNILHDKVHFEHIPATYAVVLIDVVALALKYYKWRYEGGVLQETRETEDLTQQYFIHKHVICPLLFDLVDIWLLQQVEETTELAHTIGIDAVTKADLRTVSQYRDMGTKYLDGRTSLVHELREVKRKTTRPEILLNSRLLYTSSPIQRVHTSVNRWGAPRLRQYEYMNIIKDLDLLHVILRVSQLNPDLPEYKNLLRELRIQFNRMYMRKPWTACVNRKISKDIETAVRAFGDLYI